MLLRTIARIAPVFFIVGALVSSCSKQSEGDRCDVLNNDEDCDGGLECVAASELLNSEADRCCPPEGDRVSDSSCRRRTGSVGATGGAGGADATGGSAGAMAGAAGSLTGGMGGEGQTVTCRYRSDCPEGQDCGPDGHCQPQCQSDRDCFPGQLCNDTGACVTATIGSGGGGAGVAGALAEGGGGTVGQAGARSGAGGG